MLKNLLLTLFISSSAIAVDHLDDYQYSFSCENAQKIVNQISAEAKIKASEIVDSGISGSYLYDNFELKLECEEVEYNDGSLFGYGTSIATKARLITTMPTCNNVTEVLSKGKFYNNYTILDESLSINFDESVSINNIARKLNQFKNLFVENGIFLKTSKKRWTGEFGTFDNYFAVSLDFPNCQ